MHKDCGDSFKCPMCNKKTAKQEELYCTGITLANKRIVEIFICTKCYNKLFHLQIKLSPSFYDEDEYIEREKIIKQYKKIQRKLYKYAQSTHKGQDQNLMLALNETHKKALMENAQEAMENYAKYGFVPYKEKQG